MNKSLLDTDILSEIGKGIDPNVARNATAYRNAFGRYTLSVISIMEVVQGLSEEAEHPPPSTLPKRDCLRRNPFLRPARR